MGIRGRNIWCGSQVTLAAGTLVAMLCMIAPRAALAAGDANSASCPAAEASPGFGAFLPDCRAYELASPVYGGGGVPEVISVTPDGNRVIVKSLTGFADNEDMEDSEGNIGSFYTFSRTPEGWTAESLSPPASRFPRMHYTRFASADLSRTLFEVAPSTAGGEEIELPSGYIGWNIAVREASGGAGHFTVLGPAVFPGAQGGGTNFNRPYAYAVVGASSDLAHVFILVHAEHGQTWPGDETAETGQSLYEYSLAEGREPLLVGVSNKGSLAGSPRVNDGATLVSDCGTAFDGVAADGERVFFTALRVNTCGARQPAVNELYARVHGTETVKISGAEAAVFRGASEDGSKVFFTEGRTLYEYDFDAPEGARVFTVASEVASDPVISRDGTHLYFTSSAALTSEAEPNGNGETAEDVGGERLYVADAELGHSGVAFVAGEASPVETTGNGAYLLMASGRDLVGTDDESKLVRQLFEYDAATGGVARVGVGQKSAVGYWCATTQLVEAGYNCDGNTQDSKDAPTVATFPRLTVVEQGGFAGEPAQPQKAASARALAANGAVVFESRLALTPQAEPGVDHGYEYVDGQVYLLSASLAVVNTFGLPPQLDESGVNAFVSTSESLVPQDTDQQASLYDARTEGGFPAPVLGSACSGEGCQGPVLAPPTLLAPASMSAPATGNNVTNGGEPSVKPVAKAKPKPCKKGLVMRKGKCVRAKRRARIGKAGKAARGRM